MTDGPHITKLRHATKHKTKQHKTNPLNPRRFATN